MTGIRLSRDKLSNFHTYTSHPWGKQLQDIGVTGGFFLFLSLVLQLILASTARLSTCVAHQMSPEVREVVSNEAWLWL